MGRGGGGEEQCSCICEARGLLRVEGNSSQPCQWVGMEGCNFQLMWVLEEFMADLYKGDWGGGVLQVQVSRRCPACT